MSTAMLPIRAWIALTCIAGCATVTEDTDPAAPVADDAPAIGDGTLVADDLVGDDEAAQLDAPDTTAEDGTELVFADDDADELEGDPENLGVLAATRQTVFVNFGGPIIRHCGSFCSDAPTNRTFVIGQYLRKSKVDFAPYTNGPRRRAIVAHLRTWFSRYNIRFTIKRPAAGPYTMAIVTPSWAPNHGVAPLDCANKNPSDIAFVFRTGQSSARFLAQEIAHELGHSFGLAHVKSSADFMQWASSGSAFTKSSYDTAHPSGKCFTGSIQNGPALLASSLGLRP